MTSNEDSNPQIQEFLMSLSSIRWSLAQVEEPGKTGDRMGQALVNTSQCSTRDQIDHYSSKILLDAGKDEHGMLTSSVIGGHTISRAKGPWDDLHSTRIALGYCCVCCSTGRKSRPLSLDQKLCARCMLCTRPACWGLPKRSSTRSMSSGFATALLFLAATNRASLVASGFLTDSLLLRPQSCLQAGWQGGEMLA